MFVVKIGGAEGNGMDSVLIDLAPRRDYVLVHGGSNEVDRLAEALGRPIRWITSPSGVVSRYTDRDTMEVFTMALTGKLNTEIVARLQSLGAPAVGLSGVDGGLLTGRRKEAVRSVDNGRVLLVKDDYSGTVQRVNGSLIQLLFDAGYVPVISPPGVTPRGELINADADRIAAQVAVAMHADTLVLLTNVPGLLREPSDPSTLIEEVPRARLLQFMDFAYGRMKKKLIAAGEALEGGVGRVVIASSQQPDPVERALDGMGTVLA